MADSNPDTSVATSRPERKATVRLGQRELSFISLAVILLITGTLLFGCYRAFLSFKAHRDTVIAQDNLLALYKAVRGYAMDYDGHLPPAEIWTESVAGYLSAPPSKPGGKLSYLHGPGDKGQVGYVYNDLASGYNLEPT